MWRRLSWGTKGREPPISKGRDSLRCRIRHGKLARRLRRFAGEIQTTPLLRGRPITRASKVRAAKSSSRRGGFAARDSIRPDSDSPCPPMRKAGPSSAESSAALSQVASPAVTSNAADVSAASGKSLSHVAESHDSATCEMSVKKSSSRWADRPVPVLQVEFPEPWAIIARAASADAETGKISKNLKWSGRWDSNPRLTAPKAVALPGCATPRVRYARLCHLVRRQAIPPKQLPKSRLPRGRAGRYQATYATRCQYPHIASGHKKCTGPAA